MTRFIMLALCVVIASCGGGSGGERVTEDNRGDRNLSGNFASDVAKGEARGVAHDAPMIGATVRAFSWEQGIGSLLLGETKTEELGDYVLEVQSENSELILQAGLNGYYLEEASGTRIDLGNNDYLTAIVGYEVGDNIDVQITPMTHLAACYADYLIEREGIGRVDARIRANSKFSGWAGVDILETKPIDVANPDNVAVNLSDGFAYGFISAGISKTMEMVSKENGIEPHSSRYATSISWSAAACSDISHDGLLNGVNENGQMALGSYLVTADFYRNIGASILQFAQSSQNVTGLTTDDLFTMANQISISSDEVFGGIAGQPVDIDGPTISSPLAPNSLINGSVSIDFTIEDALRVQDVVFYIDDNLYATAQPNNPTLNWNTTVFPDGEYTVRVVATDVLGNESQESYLYQVVNNGAAVEITSPTLVNTLSYTATGTFLSGVAEVASVQVNGVLAELNQEKGTWQVEIDLVGGKNLVEAKITDTLNNTNSDSIEVAVDLFDPRLTVRPLPVDYTNYDGLLNRCESLSLDLGSLPGRPLCLNSEKISLNSRKITSLLGNDDFLIFTFNLIDPKGSNGIFSDSDKIELTYEVHLNDELIIERSSVPRVDVSDEAVLPVTTEYFGDDFFQVTRDDLFTVNLKGMDEAGNVASLSIDFKLDVITPHIELTQTVENDSIFSVPFTNRSLINNNTLFIKYESSPSTVPYLISIGPSKDHSISHEYEGSIRENQYRVVTEEHWRARFCEGCMGTYKKTPEEYSFGPWESIDAIDYQGPSDSAFRRLSRPEPSATEYQFVNADTVSALPGTEWQDQSDYRGYRCGYITYPHPDFITASINSVANLKNPITGEPAYYGRCNSLDVLMDTRVSFFYFQKKTTHTIEYLSGYPKNSITSVRELVDFNTDRIRVIDNRTGSEIFPTDGWYRIPRDTAFTIVKEVTIPSIVNHNDLRVASNDSSVPYGTTIYYDKRIEWSFDNRISLTRAIDSGVLDTSGVSSVTTEYGDGFIQYVLSR